VTPLLLTAIYRATSSAAAAGGGRGGVGAACAVVVMEVALAMAAAAGAQNISVTKTNRLIRFMINKYSVQTQPLNEHNPLKQAF
jgi:hypothetical protein